MTTARSKQPFSFCSENSLRDPALLHIALPTHYLKIIFCLILFYNLTHMTANPAMRLHTRYMQGKICVVVANNLIQ